jgi:uncharacterized Zn-finger protein
MTNKKLKPRTSSKGPVLEFKEKSTSHALHRTADANTAFLARVKFNKNLIVAAPLPEPEPDVEKPFSFSKSELSLNHFSSQQGTKPPALDYSSRRPLRNDITAEKLRDVQTHLHNYRPTDLY